MENFFIIGNPRSGTSLLRLMLNAHPQIVVPPECGFLQWWYSKYGEWSDKDNNLLMVSNFIADLKTSKKIETWNIDFAQLAQEIITCRPSNYGNLCTLIYLFFGTQKDKNATIIGDKNNYYIFHLPELLSIWPRAKFIFMVRDGRDVACSYIALNKLQSKSPYKPKLPFEIDEIANEWKANNELVLDFFSNYPDVDYIMIRYEDLVTKTENTLTLLCSFLDVDFRIEMLNYFISNQLNQDEPALTLDWKLKTMEKPDPSNIGKYHGVLNKEEIRRFNELTTDLLIKFKYLQ